MMTGSEKQIAWATDIKQDAIKNLKDWYVDMSAKRTKRPDADEMFAGILAKIESINSAKWWIDNRRFVDPADLIKMVHSGRANSDPTI